MKAVMMSIQPKWAAKIASGEKTIEVRKSAPKMEVPFKCYIYVTKCKTKEDYFIKSENFGWITCPKGALYNIDETYNANGKVVGEFVCNEILTIDCDSVAPFCKEWDRYVDKETCLTAKELFAYSSNICYGWHISNLKIYDKPKELSEFDKPCSHECTFCDYYFGGSFYEPPSCNCDDAFMLTRPPQSWCYVEELKQ